MTSRDDFTEKTKELMAKKVGYLCSKPDCRQPTVGSKSDGSGFIKLGTAAHITAAAEGGPRYNPELSSDKRKDEANGVWLCPDHGRLIDSDDAHFTVETLHAWKADAEKCAFEALAYAIPGNLPDIETPKISDLSFIQRLGLPETDGVEEVTENLIEVAKADLRGFKTSVSWPEHPVFLGLKLVIEDSAKPFDASNLVAVSGSFNEITVIAPPGTGKTTTLLQFSEGILEQEGSVAVYMPLSEWAVKTDGFLQSISNRGSFAGFQPEHLMLMAHYGRLTLALDGWNELNENAKQKASLEIKSLKRVYPDLRIILSTRQKELDVPLSGPVVKIDNLSENQQKEIAVSLRGDEGENLIDHAWRTPGIRDLISIPLYLTALLSHTPGGNLPTTKEEVLRMFVDNHEQDAEKATELKKKLLGVHRKILITLAAEATYEVTTALSESKARTVSKGAIDRLIEQGQLASPIEPATALNSFVDLHILVRSEEDEALSFQHQQFQEWYASFHVEALMLSAANGNAEDLKSLRENVLDHRHWEEPVLFACERLSRADENGVNAVSSVILKTLEIDPLLSAEMIYRSSEEVWKKAEAEVLGFVQNWHTPSQVDRAVIFMINAGRPEFFDMLWPLISHEDNQVHLTALRAGQRFRVSVLGDDIPAKISKLNEKLRKNIISEIAHYGDIPGMELATQLAITDANSDVKFATINSLLFRHAERHAIQVLNSSPEEVWTKLATRGYANDISDPECQKRLNAEVEKYTKEEEADSHKKINALLYLPKKSAETEKKIETLLTDMEVPASDEPHYRWTVENEHEMYPDAVINALLKRLESDKEMPFMAENYLYASGIIVDEGPIVDTLLSQEKTEQQEKNARFALTVVGPMTVGKLIDRLIKNNEELMAQEGPRPKDLEEEHRSLEQQLSQTNDEAFINALLNRPAAKNSNEIALLAELVKRHGDSYERQQYNISEDTMSQAVVLVESWAEAILKFKEARRYELSEVAGAIERFAAPQLVPALQKLLDEDLARRQEQEKEFLEGLKTGQKIQNGARCFFYRKYTTALAAIGDDAAVNVLKHALLHPDCGDDAALALRAIWKKNQPSSSEDSRFMRSPDFTEAKDRRESRGKGGATVSDKFAEVILSVVSDIISSDPDEKKRHHALKLARIAFTMPYGDKTELINTLIQLPGPVSEKKEILTALATAGETISAELILQGINDTFTAAEEKKNEWMLTEQDGYRIKQWISLLAFSDHPEAIIEVFERYKERCPNVCEPYNMGDLLSVLSYSPSSEAEQVLKKLAEIEPGFLNEHNWLRALMMRKTLSAGEYFLDLILREAFVNDEKRIESRTLVEKLANLLSKFPELRQEVYQKYKGADPTPCKGIMESAIANAPDNEGILLLIKECAAQGQNLRSTSLYFAIKDLLVGERQSKHWIGTRELYSVPAPELRKDIFEILTSGDENEARLAKECLVVFDHIRDKYGVAESETRHPDVSTGIPWPQIEKNEKRGESKAQAR